MALQAHIPLHTTIQKQRFCIPLIALLRMPHAENNGVGQGWRSKRTYPCTPVHYKPKSAFLHSSDSPVQNAPCTELWSGSGVALCAHIPCALQARNTRWMQKHCFWLVVCSPQSSAWGSLNMTIRGMQKRCFWLVACSGMCARSATPDPLHYSLHGPF